MHVFGLRLCLALLQTFKNPRCQSSLGQFRGPGTLPSLLKRPDTVCGTLADFQDPRCQTSSAQIRPLGTLSSSFHWSATVLAPSQTFRNPVPNELSRDSTSRDPPEFIAPVCDCLWHPRRLPGTRCQTSQDSTSRHPPKLIALVCACLWHILADFQERVKPRFDL